VIWIFFLIMYQTAIDNDIYSLIELSHVKAQVCGWNSALFVLLRLRARTLSGGKLNSRSCILALGIWKQSKE